MKQVRRIVMWTVVGAVALLGILSIIGAFVGVQHAISLFNSIPLAVFWVFLAALCISGFVFFKRLRSSPGLLAAHLAPVLILVGAIHGSDAGHALEKRFLGTRRIPSGYMRVYEGHMTNVVRDNDGKEIGKLSFNIGLKDFWIEYYEAEERPWLLGVDAPPAAGHDGRHGEVIDWAVGQEMDIPLTDFRLKVLQYLPGAQPTFAADAEAKLEITEKGGKKTVIPGKLGQEVSLENPKSTLRIVQVFSHLVVQADHKVVDLPGSRANPALKVELDRPDGKADHRYAYSGGLRSTHGQEKDGLELRYVLPEPTSAEPDPESQLPAMEVLVSRGKETLHAWLLARGLDQRVVLSLAPLIHADPREEQPCPEHEKHVHDPNAYLIMLRRQDPIKDYKSRLVVQDEGQQIAEKDIEVNDPLHYGGYHFYQASYDVERGQYTTLRVKSDLGLWPVYSGFFLLCAGTFWLFWVQPAWVYLTKRGDHGD